MIRVGTLAFFPRKSASGKASAFVLAGLITAAALLQAAPARAFDKDQREEIGAIVRDYLIAHPEVLQEAFSELEKRQAAAEGEKQASAIAQHEATIFHSSRQIVLGNPKGDVSFVEFFDYNCGYCKRALSDMLTLLKDDANLRVVLKEFPVLGSGSVEAAQVAIALRMQDRDGKLYLPFHQNLLSGRGEANRARALEAAKSAGADMDKLQADMKSDEVKATLSENFTIAQALGMNGTPSYVIGKNVVIGAIGLDGLKEKINQARCGKSTC